MFVCCLHIILHFLKDIFISVIDYALYVIGDYAGCNRLKVIFIFINNIPCPSIFNNNIFNQGNDLLSTNSSEEF